MQDLAMALSATKDEKWMAIRMKLGLPEMEEFTPISVGDEIDSIVLFFEKLLRSIFQEVDTSSGLSRINELSKDATLDVAVGLVRAVANAVQIIDGKMIMGSIASTLNSLYHQTEATLESVKPYLGIDGNNGDRTTYALMLSSSETQVFCTIGGSKPSASGTLLFLLSITCGPSSPLILNTNSSSMSLQWNAPLQPDYVITAYTLHHRVPSLKSQSEMWAPPSTATVQFHTYNPSGILFYQINSVMTDFLGVKLHGGLPWLIFDVSCRWIQQYQNLQRWSVAHCELHNSSVMLSLYGYVVLFEQASNTFYVTVDTVYAAAITAAIVPLLTMKVYFEGFPSTLSRFGIATPYSIQVSYPLLNALDGFDAMSVQNVGSTYIIVSWDLPTHSNGILINFSLYCNGALAGVLPLTVISYNTTGLLPFTLYMHMSSSHARRHCTPVGTWCWASSVLQPACPVMNMYTSRDISGKITHTIYPPCTDFLES
ncbi:hypothetical protein EMCRGX_G024015 [Ephydatia muelleri]